MMRYGSLLAVLILLCPLPALAAALPPDGDSGLAGFTVQGSVSIVTSSTLGPEGTTVSPVHGSQMIKMISNGADTSMLGGTNGSILTTPFSFTAGQTYAFWWLFDARDSLSHNDFASVIVDLNSDGIADFQQVLSSVAKTGDYGNSGWQHFSAVAPFNVSGTLGWVVSNTGDQWHNSILYLDAPVSAVPEPMSVLLLGSGTAAMGFWRRVRSVC
jgi:hypothetical protein